ncbi:Dicer-like protein 1 [Allomyces javanicus]|nr:Dicer-like protein 1 [Allomyces javanicus]
MTSSTPTAYALREYQRAVLAAISAHDGNVLFTLKTGAGKTCILFETYLRKRDAATASSGSRALAVFIAQEQALVSQQRQRFLDMAHQRGVNLVTDEVFGGKLPIHDVHRNDVLFVTPVRLLALINGGIVDLGRVALVLVDEAHHAAKDHPYTHVCRRICEHNAAVRRQIGERDATETILMIGCSATLVQGTIGLVASHHEFVQAALDELCRMLDNASVVAITPETASADVVAELDAVVPNVTVSCIHFPNVRDMAPFRNLFRATWTMLQAEIQSLRDAFHDEWAAIDKKHAELFRLPLDPACQALDLHVAQFPVASVEAFIGFCGGRLYKLLTQHRLANAAGIDLGDSDDSDSLGARVDLTTSSLTITDVQRLIDTLARVDKLGHAAIALLEFGPACAVDFLTADDALANVFKGTAAIADLFARLLQHKDAVSPKLAAIFELVELQLDPTSSRATRKGIVFVRRRHTARQLANMLNRRFEHLHADYFVGSNAKRGSAGGESIKSSVDVLDRFRTEICRLLVCTSVAEEGIDVPLCSLVVHGDPTVLTTTKLTQIKGRARAQDGRCYVLCESNEVDAGPRPTRVDMRKPAVLLPVDNAYSKLQEAVLLRYGLVQTRFAKLVHESTKCVDETAGQLFVTTVTLRLPDSDVVLRARSLPLLGKKQARRDAFNGLLRQFLDVAYE